MAVNNVRVRDAIHAFDSFHIKTLFYPLINELFGAQSNLHSW
jgi:hypothetical protein